jgi:hypothetical protein
MSEPTIGSPQYKPTTIEEIRYLSQWDDSFKRIVDKYYSGDYTYTLKNLRKGVHLMYLSTLLITQFIDEWEDIIYVLYVPLEKRKKFTEKKREKIYRQQNEFWNKWRDIYFKSPNDTVVPAMYILHDSPAFNTVWIWCW